MSWACLGTAAEPTFHTGRRARWRSQRHVQEILDEMKGNKEKWAAADAKWAAEEERRRNSPRAERLKETAKNYYVNLRTMTAWSSCQLVSPFARSCCGIFTVYWCLVQVKEEVAFAGLDSVVSIWGTCEACNQTQRRLGGRLALSVSVSSS